MRRIDGQIVASTSLDAHGERLSRAELEELFAQMPDSHSIARDHDLTQPPAGRATNKRLVQLRTGDWAIKLDIELAEDNAAWRGLSIGAHRGRAPQASNTSLSPPLASVSFNPRQFDSAVMDSIASRVEPSIAFVERTEKSDVLTLAIVYVVCQIPLKIWEGFWTAAGTTLFSELQRALAKPLDETQPTKLAIVERAPDLPTELVLTIADDVGEASLAAVDVEALVAEGAAITPSQEVAKVAAIIDGSGEITIDFVVDKDGVCYVPRE